MHTQSDGTTFRMIFRPNHDFLGSQQYQRWSSSLLDEASPILNQIPNALNPLTDISVHGQGESLGSHYWTANISLPECPL